MECPGFDKKQSTIPICECLFPSDIEPKRKLPGVQQILTQSPVVVLTPSGDAARFIRYQEYSLLVLAVRCLPAAHGVNTFELNINLVGHSDSYTTQQPIEIKFYKESSKEVDNWVGILKIDK